MGMASTSNIGQGQPLIEPLRERILEGVQKHAYAIASVALIIIATVVTAIVACGIVHPAVIAVAVVGILAAGIAGYFAVSSICPDAKTPIPKGFLEEIRYCYGDVMYNFIVKKGVTIHELRVVMRWVNSGFSTQLRGSAKIKAESFGLNKLKNDARKEYRPLFDDFLVQNCPAYLMRRFVALGDPQLPQEKGMSPERYWTSPLGFVDDTYTAFDTRTWLLAQVMTKEEYTLLSEFTKNGLWHQTTAVISDLQTRMLNRLEHVPTWQLFKENGDPIENINDDRWFRRLFDHGVSWAQIQMLGKIDIMFLGLFEGIPLEGYDEKLLTAFNESNENYDHEEALICGQEMILPKE
ncbi:DUF1389 domain-containing protein [Chlamydia vaughanii]|uniref:DUF1389 domain-containing protein n=1 Tax=Chlamydia vaughanii TaxID=3112552 RepID=UPI0032B2B177